MQAYPFDVDWNAVYSDPAQPLVVDIGSGMVFHLLSPLFSFSTFCWTLFPCENYKKKRIKERNIRVMFFSQEVKRM